MGTSKKRNGKKGKRGISHTGGGLPWYHTIKVQVGFLSVGAVLVIAGLMQVSLPGSGVDAAVACSLLLICQTGLLFLFPREREGDSKALRRGVSRAESENALEKIAELLGLARPDQSDIEASIKQLVSSESHLKQQLVQAKETAQKEVPRLELECGRLQADLVEAHSTVESLRRELDELQAKHQREISGFSERLTSASTEISRNSQAAETLRSEILRLEQELQRQREEVANLTSLQAQELEWAESVTDELAWNLEAHTALVGVVAYLQFHWRQESQEARSTWIDQAIRPVEAALEQRHIERLEAHGARAFKLFGSSFYGVEGMSASTLEIARSVNFDESSFESFRRLTRSKTSDAAANFVAQHLPENLRPVVVELLR